jgi:hypothetical protein
MAGEPIRKEKTAKRGSIIVVDTAKVFCGRLVKKREGLSESFPDVGISKVGGNSPQFSASKYLVHGDFQIRHRRARTL